MSTSKLSKIAASNTTTNNVVGHNGETANVKALVLSIVQSLEMIDEEREAQKELLVKLETDHGIDKKVAKKVAKLIHKKNKQEQDDEISAVDELYSRLAQ